MAKQRIKKILKYSFLSILALYLLAVLIGPLVALNFLSNKHVNYSRVFTSEEAGLPDSDTLWLKSDDGYRIHVLETKPEGAPKGAIICLTGIESPSVTYFYGHARLFRELGLVTLMPEVRGHGLSDGDRICLAYQERADVKAVSDYVKSTYADIPLIVMGLSMGASIAINSIGSNDDIDALVSVSAFTSVEDLLSGYIGNVISRPLAWLFKWPTSVYSSFKFGVNAFKESPLRSISQLKGRPALMMHSRQDSQVPYACFERLTAAAEIATDKLERYVVDGDQHFVSSSFGVPEDDEAYYDCLKAFLESVIQ